VTRGSEIAAIFAKLPKPLRKLLASRALLVKIKRDLENQVRGLLKNFGLVII
jgi:hypothetical protein